MKLNFMSKNYLLCHISHNTSLVLWCLTPLNNISAISWRSVLSADETGVPGENHRPAASHWQNYNIMMSRVHIALTGFELTPFVVKGIDCIGSCKSNYHTNRTTTAPGENKICKKSISKKEYGRKWTWYTSQLYT